MTPLYVFDLDGTLADLTHRLHYVRKPWDERQAHPEHILVEIKNWKPNWDKFFEEVDKDQPVQWVIDLLNLMRQHGEILILSGRSDVTEVKTRNWLRSNNVLYGYLVMRPERDHKPDTVLKKHMLQDFLKDKDYQVQFIVDDRQSVVDMWRENGYKVLQCNAWKEKSEG